MTVEFHLERTKALDVLNGLDTIDTFCSKLNILLDASVSFWYVLIDCLIFLRKPTLPNGRDRPPCASQYIQW